MRREESRRLLLLVLVSRDLLAEVLPLFPLLWPYVHTQSLLLLKAANQNRRALLLVLEAALPPASLVSLVLRRLVDVEVSTQRFDPRSSFSHIAAPPPGFPGGFPPPGFPQNAPFPPPGFNPGPPGGAPGFNPPPRR